MKEIRKQISKDQFHLYNIPEDFAEEAEVVILAIKPAKQSAKLLEDEKFYAANNNQVIEDDKKEDMIWGKYL